MISPAPPRKSTRTEDAVPNQLTLDQHKTKLPVPMSPDCSGQSSHALENAARLGLSSRDGHALTDEEWAQMRAKLLEFVTILGSWVNRDRNTLRGLGNVEALCQREP